MYVALYNLLYYKTKFFSAAAYIRDEAIYTQKPVSVP